MIKEDLVLVLVFFDFKTEKKLFFVKDIKMKRTNEEQELCGSYHHQIRPFPSFTKLIGFTPSTSIAFPGP